MLLKDIRLIFHEKRTIVLFAVLLLTAAVGIFMAKEPSEGHKVAIGVCDNDDSEYSRLLLTYFEDNEIFSSYITLVKGDEPELKKGFSEGILDLYMIIPEDFTENMINIDNVPIRVYINSSDRTKAVVYKNLLDSYCEYISSVEACCQTLYNVMREEGYSREDRDEVNVRISYDLVFTALGKDDMFDRTEVDRIEGVSLANYYIYSMIAVVIMYFGLAAGLGYLNEKLSDVRTRLISGGVSGISQIISKDIAYTLVSGVTVSAVLLMMNGSGGLSFDTVTILFVFASCFISSVLFTVIASFAGSAGGYCFFANSLILILMICGGGIIPIMYLPEAMAKVARLMPNYWFIRFLM